MTTIFSSLVICGVYISIIFESVSICQARDLRSIGYGIVNEDTQDHATFQNPSKSPETTKTKMTIMSSEDNTSTKMKSEDNKMNDTNGQQVYTNGMKIRARSIPPSLSPKGKSSTRRIANKTKQKLPRAMATWPVPRPKKNKNDVHQQQQHRQRQRQRQRPFFDLDYAPPKVHPPTHN